MRVLQVTPYFAPAWAYGGPPRVLTDFATGLAARGHNVTVLTTDVLDEKRRAGPPEELLDGVRIQRFRNVSNALAWRTKKYLPPGLVVELARSVRHFDVVHVTDARTLLTAAAHLATLLTDVPLCFSAHGSLPGSPGFRGAVKAAYDRALVRPMLARAALLLAQTAHERQLFVEAGGRARAVRMLPLPLECDPDEVRRRPRAVRERIGLPDGAPLAVFLGRIHYLKGLDILVDALRPLLASGLLTLAVVGRDDGAWAEVEERFSDLLERRAVVLVGPIYGDERFSAYADADVFCLTPRHWEETSLAALEAAACGTPVVVTEQADIPGLAEAGGGFVVPLDPLAIRGAVERALACGYEVGARGREYVRRKHAKAHVVDLLERYLLEVCDRFESA